MLTGVQQTILVQLSYIFLTIRYFVKLDCAKLKTTFGWKPHWNLDTAIEKVAEWSKCYLSGGDVRACMDEEITAFLSAGE